MSKGIHPIPAQESDSNGVERAYQAQFKFHCRLASMVWQTNQPGFGR
jgi:hypothetical protein